MTTGGRGTLFDSLISGLRGSPQDRLLFRRTLAGACLALAAGALVVVGTDEAASTAGMRLARLAALAPVAAAVATLAVVAQSKGRGEVRAVTALGVAPWASVRGARTAAVLFGLLTPLGLLVPGTDPRSLFPSARAPAEWVIADGEALDRADGVRIGPEGGPSFVAPLPARDRPEPSTMAALLCLWPVAALVPLWAVTPMAVGGRLLGAFGTVAASVLILHAMASGRVGAAAGPLAVLPLAIALVRGRWHG